MRSAQLLQRRHCHEGDQNSRAGRPRSHRRIFRGQAAAGARRRSACHRRRCACGADPPRGPCHQRQAGILPRCGAGRGRACRSGDLCHEDVWLAAGHRGRAGADRPGDAHPFAAQRRGERGGRGEDLRLGEHRLFSDAHQQRQGRKHRFVRPERRVLCGVRREEERSHEPVRARAASQGVV